MIACVVEAEGGPPSADAAVPAGDPSFPTFTGSWIIDTTNNTLSTDVVTQTNTVLQKLRDDGIAEIVIVVVTDVKQPELWATHFGRNIKLGDSETNNGIVYLMRPDAPKNERIIYSIGRGLPEFTSGRVTDAVQQASDAANAGDYNAAALSLVQGTDVMLRQIHVSTPTSQPDSDTSKSDKKSLTPEQQKKLITTVLIIAAIWFVIGLFILPFDSELAVQWWYLGLRLFLIILSGGKAGGTGGSGKFGGRSGSR